MSKQGKRMRNPTYAAGVKQGIEIGKKKTFEVVEEVIIDLCNEKGVGPVMQEKIRNALGKIPRRVQVEDNDFK